MQDREVGAGVEVNHDRVSRTTGTGRRHGHPIGAGDDVGVGDDVIVGDDPTGALEGGAARAGLTVDPDDRGPGRLHARSERGRVVRGLDRGDRFTRDPAEDLGEALPGHDGVEAGEHRADRDGDGAVHGGQDRRATDDRGQGR